MNKLEQVCEFAVWLGERMLVAGATLERVNDTMTRVCNAYDYYDISIFSLNSVIILSIRTQDGLYCSRQRAVRNPGIHLSRLSALNQLSRDVCANKPDPETLGWELTRAEQTAPEYPGWIILLSTMCAQVCLNLILGGNWMDAISMALIAAIIYGVNIGLNKPGLNKIVCNAVAMFIGSTAGILSVYMFMSSNLYLLLVNCCMYMLPGVPMVFSIQNLLCGNEVNGAVSFARVCLEMMGIVGGMALAEIIFGGIVIW